MKKLFIAALLAVTITGFAQEKRNTKGQADKEPMERFTPEQQNELMLKKLTLELDLSSKQQAQMKSVIAEKSAQREAMMKAHKDTKTKPTRDERFAMKSKMLDEQIAMKSKMKNLLSAEQYAKWEAMKEKQGNRRAHRMHKKMGDKMDRKKEMQK